MSRYNTGNPLDSNSAKDLDDNAKNADLFLNSEDLSWNDRLNKQRKTIAGIESDGNDAVNGIIADGANAIAGLGYVPLDDGIWATGKTFTSYNQYLVYSEATYKVKSSTSLPYGPTGATPDLNDVEAFDGSLLFAEKCRFSKLDNPLVRIFNKNKIVESLNGSLSFTRDSTATYIDRYGKVQTAGFDEPRQQGDGWLIESSSTNHCLHSGRQDNPAYTHTGTVTLTPSENFGEFTPSKFVPYSDLSIQTLPQQMFNPVIGENSITYVIKAAEYGDVVQFGSTALWSPSIGFQLCKINFRTGQIISGSQYVTRLEQLGNGYWLFTHKFEVENANPTGSTAQLFSNDNQQTWQPDGVGGIYVAFVQYEQNPYSTSLIETTDSPVTRLADTITMPAKDNMPPLKQMSFAVELSDINYSVDSPVLFKIDYQVLVVALLSIDPGGYYYAGVRNQSGAFDQEISNIQHVAGEIRFFVVTITDDFIKLYIDGELSAQTAATGPRKEILDLNDIYFRFISTANRGSAQYNNLRIWDFELNQAEITFLSGEE